MSDREHDKRPEKLVAGLVLMTLGTIFLLGRLDFLDYDGLHTYWPMIIVAVGLGKFLSAAAGHRRPGEGLFLIFLGLWIQANVSHWFGLTWHNSWPVMLVYAGLCMVVKEFFPSSERRESRENTEVSRDH